MAFKLTIDYYKLQKYIKVKLTLKFMFLMMVLSISCSKENDTNNNNNNNNNPQYKFECPKIDNNFCILNSKNLSFTVLNSGVHPLTAKISFNKASSNTGTLNYRAYFNKYVGSGIEFRYPYETGGNCNELVLRNASGNILRSINFVANDSFAIMKDPILCPDKDFFLVNDKYLDNYLINKDKNECQKTQYYPYTRLCLCGLKNSGNKCKSEHKSYEIDFISNIISSYINGTDVYVLNSFQDFNSGNQNVLEIIKLDKDKLVWRKDITSLFINSIYWQGDNNENFATLPNGNLLFGSVSKNSGNTSSAILLEIDQQTGNIVNQKKYTINSLINDIGVKVFAMNNNEYIMEIKSFNYYLVFNANLQLILAKKRPNINDQSLENNINNLVSDGNYIYKIYHKINLGNNFEFVIYKYNNRIEFQGISVYDPTSLLKYGNDFFYFETNVLSDKTIILINLTNDYPEQGYEWHRIKTDGTLIAKGIIFVSSSGLNSAKAFLDNNKIFFAFDNFNSTIVAKCDAISGKNEYTYVFTPETSFECEDVMEVFKEDNFISVITTGTHNRFNILKFKFTEESLYNYEVCN